MPRQTTAPLSFNTTDKTNHAVVLNVPTLTLISNRITNIYSRIAVLLFKQRQHYFHFNRDMAGSCEFAKCRTLLHNVFKILNETMYITL